MKPNSLFGDNAVLQRAVEVPVWGTAHDGEHITVTFAGQKASTVATNGHWMVRLKPLSPGGPFTLAINNLTFTNVLIGDVWIASGQSNIERPLCPRPPQPDIDNWQQEVADANYPEIRQFLVTRRIATAPEEDVGGKWTVCSPQTVADFSAVGYFFARDVYKARRVPIGLIHSSWGGTAAEAWTSEAALSKMLDFVEPLAELKHLVADPEAARREMHAKQDAWYARVDPGSKSGLLWSATDLDVRDWKTMKLPTLWENAGYPDFDGIFWFRRTFDLPSNWNGEDVELHLGAADDNDTTWVNGKEVGATIGWDTPRVYRVPCSALQRTNNIIAVRVLDTGAGGGLWGGDDPMRVRVGTESVSLTGPWLCMQSVSLRTVGWPPSDFSHNANAPTVLYNGMIAPLQPFPIKGVIWYQGESNDKRAKQYRDLFPLLIADWRRVWGPVPFLFVQIAPFKDLSPEIREAQLLTLAKSPHTAMAVITDAGDANDIHPAHKQPVGARLALAARALAYGEQIEYSGPLFDSMKVESDRAILKFTHTGGGLVAKGGDLKGFIIAGADKKFVPAKAEIDGDTVIISSVEVPQPVAVRYGWANVPEGNLFNKEGLPASPFRTDIDEPAASIPSPEVERQPEGEPGVKTTNDLVLWYQQPARSAMNEALPIGNGRLGGVVFGGIERERIQFNEDSLWTGDDNPSGDYDTMGAYQKFGDLFLESASARTNPATNYRRQLDLATATARTEFNLDGVRHVREAFASRPTQVIVVRWSADKPGAITGRVELTGAHNEPTTVDGSTLSFRGTLGNGMSYEAQARVLARGGTVDGTQFKNCDEVVVLLAAGTDYAMDHAKGFRGELRSLNFPSKSYDELKIEHVKDFQSLFNRVTLDLGPGDDSLPTDKRKWKPDPGLAALLFQYGRYLLISCSRPGGLPANLQGLWNDSNNPPWHCDYHSNINVEMNYWPAEVAYLPECHTPFFDLVVSQLPAWRKASGAKRGFAIRTSHNITGGMGWKWDKAANAWYCQHFWEHIAFGRDTNYLREVAYPIIKETVEYWEDHLKTLPDGRLVVPDGWSPEHGPDEDGVSYSQQLVWDLFSNYIEAADALGTDKQYRNTIAGMRDKLVGPQIGKWGQLQEWMTDRDDPNDHHRHTSHLFAVYPGRLISATKTPELASAAKVSIDARGIDPASDVREWSFAWRTALYARLHDGENAHRMLQQLFSDRNTCPNLFGLHPPMQLDGNFGITAGIAEMLVQSHEGEINLLPALPSAWPTGRVTGLRARGGFEVGLRWKDRKSVEATIHSLAGQPCRVRYGDRAEKISIRKNETVTWRP